jgi:4-alpha-glucanotransferase
LSLITEDECQQALQIRHLEKQALIMALKGAGLISAAFVEAGTINAEPLSFENIMGPWCEWVASGESGLFSVQLCDLITQIPGVNIPGTWKEYPNWQQRLSMSLDEISQSSQVDSWVKAIDKARRKA